MSYFKSNEKLLLEPRYTRVFDIGTTFEIVRGSIVRQFMVENFIGASGAFEGGAGCSSMEKFKAYILRKYSYSLDELQQTTENIAQEYLKRGAESNIQIDSFIYVDSDGIPSIPSLNTITQYSD